MVCSPLGRLGDVEQAAATSFASLAKRLQSRRRRRRNQIHQTFPSGPRPRDTTRNENSVSPVDDRVNAEPPPNEPTSLSPSFDDLPDELLLKIVSYIHPLSETFTRLRQTSCRFHNLMETTCLYRVRAIDLSHNRPFDFDTLRATMAASAETLTDLDLSHSSDVTDYGLYHLVMTCRQVVRVDISYCAQLTNCGLRILTNLTRLERIDISGCPLVTSRGVHFLFKLNNDSLTQVAMNNCLGLRSDPHNLLHISKFGNKLKHLEMAWDGRLMKLNPLNEVDIDSLTEHFGQLEYLDISGSRCTDSGLEAVATHCPKLRTLKLRHCLINDVGLKYIAELLPDLRHLDISDCHDVTDVGLEFLGGGCFLLEYLDISRCFSLLGDGLASLADSCKHLRTVIARECFDLTEVVVEYLSLSCRHVRHLDVAFNQGVTDDTLLMIATDRKPGEEMVVVTAGCPRVGLDIAVDGESDDAHHRFRFVDWKGKEVGSFLIWETAV
ncbi:uncharacterized protein [Diadema antillarum]|uniref:uncharacterized protein n=1 Tax=Diadema antillarum TaxID=105358 RepID=UPI003A87C591